MSRQQPENPTGTDPAQSGVPGDIADPGPVRNTDIVVEPNTATHTTTRANNTWLQIPPERGLKRLRSPATSAASRQNPESNTNLPGASNPSSGGSPIPEPPIQAVGSWLGKIASPFEIPSSASASAPQSAAPTGTTSAHPSPYGSADPFYLYLHSPGGPEKSQRYIPPMTPPTHMPLGSEVVSFPLDLNDHPWYEHGPRGIGGGTGFDRGSRARAGSSDESDGDDDQLIESTKFPSAPDWTEKVSEPTEYDRLFFNLLDSSDVSQPADFICGEDPPAKEPTEQTSATGSRSSSPIAPEPKKGSTHGRLHPLFDRSQITCSNGDYNTMLPSLHLATNFLTAVPFLPFWHTLFFGPEELVTVPEVPRPSRAANGSRPFNRHPPLAPVRNVGRSRLVPRSSPLDQTEISRTTSALANLVPFIKFKVRPIPDGTSPNTEGISTAVEADQENPDGPPEKSGPSGLDGDPSVIIIHSTYFEHLRAGLYYRDFRAHVLGLQLTTAICRGISHAAWRARKKSTLGPMRTEAEPYIGTCEHPDVGAAWESYVFQNEMVALVPVVSRHVLSFYRSGHYNSLSAEQLAVQLYKAVTVLVEPEPDRRACVEDVVLESNPHDDIDSQYFGRIRPMTFNAWGRQTVIRWAVGSRPLEQIWSPSWWTRVREQGHQAVGDIFDDRTGWVLRVRLADPIALPIAKPEQHNLSDDDDNESNICSSCNLCNECSDVGHIGLRPILSARHGPLVRRLSDEVPSHYRRYFCPTDSAELPPIPHSFVVTTAGLIVNRDRMANMETDRSVVQLMVAIGQAGVRRTGTGLERTFGPRARKRKWVSYEWLPPNFDGSWGS